jgi:hypothetical protein
MKVKQAKNAKESLAKLNDPNILMLSTREAAFILGVAYTTVYEAVKKTGCVMNDVEVVRVGKRILVPTIALRKALGMSEWHKS